jgi:heme exporter protein B
MTPFLALFRRDVLLAVRAGGGAASSLGFFVAVAALVPLGLGPDPELLAHVAGGVLWVAAALAALLSLDRMFQTDYEDGSLDAIALAPLPLELSVLAKALAHWLTTGLPLALIATLPALMFDLSPRQLPSLAAALLIGTPAISALGAVGAALTLSLRRGGLVMPLIVLPLIAPAVIFGAGAASEGAPGGAFYFLAAFSLLAVLLAPFAAASAVRLHLAE